jgi:Zn-dependent protease
VNPVRFNREFNGKRVTMATGMMITAAAGPASNLVFGFFCAILLKVAMVAGIVNESILMILLYLVMVNYGLAIFNMIPIPPLDGSKVLAGLLPRHIARYFDYLEANTLVSFIILIALLRTGVLGKVMGPVFQGMLRTTSALLELPFF